MLLFFDQLKCLLKSNRRSSETFIFYLHYRITFLILIGSSVLLTTNQLVGEKIRCVSKQAAETEAINSNFLETYCWASSTYSINSAYFNEVGLNIIYPGVSVSKNKQEHTYRNYYQYIYICLFIQALFFYLPHLIWKTLEGKDLKNVIEIINYSKSYETERDETKTFPLEEAAVYIEERWGTHNNLFRMYIFCEILSFFNLLIQVYVVDVFLHGEFLAIGLLHSLHYNSDWMTDPIHVFPLITSCYFKRFGASGHVDVIDALCVLPLNALNVKIYLFMWIWFVILMCLTLINLFNLFLNLFFNTYRMIFTKLYCSLFEHQTDKVKFVDIFRVGNAGDWFVLNSIKKHMDSLNYYRLVKEISTKLSNIEEVE